MATAVLARLGRWVAELEPDQVPALAWRGAHLQVLNEIAAAYAALRSPQSACIAFGLAGWSSGTGRSTVLGTGPKHAPVDAALANSALSMAQDFDDIVWMGHTGHSAVFASLAVAEHEGSDARRFLTAVVAANEVGGRLGASALFGPLNGQMWTFVHLVAAAAATSKLLGLDASQTTHALGIALAQPPFALQPGFMTPTSKLLAAATPTAIGIRAAYFARAGMTGEPTLIEDPRGFWARFSYLPLATMMDDLGELWTTESLAIKTFPGCHYFQTALSAIERILARAPVGPDDIVSVRITTTKLAVEAERFAGEYARLAGTVTPVNVNFDLATSAAILLHAGRLTGAEVDPAWLAENTAAITALRRRVTVVHDPALTLRTLAGMWSVGSGRAALREVGVREVLALRRRYRAEYRSELITAREAAGWIVAVARLAARRRPKRAERTRRPGIPLPFPNHVRIRLRDGRELEERVDLPVGSLCAPQVEAELERKVLREVGAVLGTERARALHAAGLALGEGEGTLAALVRELSPAG
jgi:2-methylcitrate dehydratase PrpD